MNPFLMGIILSTILAYLSYKKKALSGSGAVGAIITGTVIFGFGQKMSWYLLLVIFFVSSSLLSFYRKRDKVEVSDQFDKTGTRDIWQVFANGGWAGILAVIGYFLQQEWAYIAYAGAVATVNADTWATEIGVLSRGNPYFILTGKKVDKGTSGAVSWLGLSGSLAGAFFIAVSALLLLLKEDAPLAVEAPVFLLAITLGGWLGALTDSVIGATIQANYRCAICGKVTEKKFHCGKKTLYHKGLKWMNNDMVNGLSSIIGSGTAVLLYVLIGYFFL